MLARDGRKPHRVRNVPRFCDSLGVLQVLDRG